MLAKQIVSGELKIDRESKKGAIQKIMSYALQYDVAKNLLFSKAKEQIMKATKGFYPAPLKVLEVSLVLMIMPLKP